MKRHLASFIAIALLSSAAMTPMAHPIEQPQVQQLEPLVNRIREALSLNEEQVGQLRAIFAKYAPKIIELRNRLQSQPYSPQLHAEVESCQRAMREELAPHLNDEQKRKLANLDAPLVAQPPPFILIDIAPRARTEASTNLPLASAERVIPQPAAGSRIGRLSEDQKILHLLNRVTFGPRPGDIDRVKRMGIDRFLDEQLHPEMIDDSELEKRLAVLPTLQMTSAELSQFYPPPNVAQQRAKEKNALPVFGRPQQIPVELIQQKLVRAVASSRQLQEVMTDFWFNHFNVFLNKDADLWYITSYERDVIRPLALGKFRDLLLAVAQSPAMLIYLDNWLSSSPDARLPHPPTPTRPPAKPAPAASSVAGVAEKSPKPAQAQTARRSGINENYARELMELHTMGVDGGYTQKDVQEVARCFTGWTVDRPFQGGQFVFRPWMHDNTSKTVLGVKIPAGGGISDGERVIEILSRHPATARFISRKLCQRFVSDNPPKQLIERVAQVFLRTDGDIREVLRAILTSAEFYSPSAFRAKVKSPLELAASALRALDGDTNGAPTLHEWLRRMGEPLYQCQPPTGYGEDSSRWMNTGVFLTRLNFLVALVNNQIPGTSYDPERLISIEAAHDVNDLADKLTALIVHTDLSAASRRAIRLGLGERVEDPHSVIRTVADVKQVVDKAAARRRIAQLIELLFGTAEFQRK
jgi:uncharacterized protein (DUF1800 family)